MDAFSGAANVFRTKRADRIKLVFWDGTGLCLFAKKLNRDRMARAQRAALIKLYFWQLCLQVWA